MTKRATIYAGAFDQKPAAKFPRRNCVSCKASQRDGVSLQTVDSLILLAERRLPAASKGPRSTSIAGQERMRSFALPVLLLSLLLAPIHAQGVILGDWIEAHCSFVSTGEISRDVTVTVQCAEALAGLEHAS